MRIRSNPLIFIALLLFTCVYAANAQHNALADSALQVLIDRQWVEGAAAAYSIDGELIWSGSAGYACPDAAFSWTTRNRTASIAKPMTAVAVMQLVEQQKIDLDLPVKTYLASFPAHDKGPVTTRQLLVHSSGIGQYQSSAETENMTYYSSLEEAMQVFINRPLLFEPGTDFFYTSYGYVVLGRLIEEVSGQPYEVYMRENIWDPAGMDQTGVEHDRENQGYACLYHRNKRKAKPAKANDLSNRVPGGGFYSTVRDLLKFGDALLDGKLIQMETFEQMLETGFVQKEGNQYGMGWFFYAPPPNENLVIGHSGEQTGASNQLMIIPKSHTVVVVMSNTSGSYREVVGLSAYLIALSERKE